MSRFQFPAAGTLDYNPATDTVFINVDKLNLSGNATVNEGTPYTLNIGSLIAPSPGTTITGYVINWGDGAANSIQTFNGDPQNTSPTYTFDNGPANVTISVYRHS